MPRKRESNFIEAAELFAWIFTHVHPLWCVPAAFGVWLFIMSIHATNPVLDKAMTGVRVVLAFTAAFAVLAGGLMGWIRRSKRSAFQREELNLKWAYRLGWRAFEEGVAEIYRNQGYDVELLGGSGPDGGIDLKMTRNGMLTVVHCKHWKAWKVGVKPVRELLGVMTAEGACRGIFITSGRFTREAREFANGTPIELVDREGFLALARTLQANLRGSGEPTGGQRLAVDPTPQPSSPACPYCGGEIALRTARRGANAGSQFWGCFRFPDCRGTRDLR